MNNVILVRYGEIFLKGKNRGFFDKWLIENIKESLSKFNLSVEKIPWRYVVSDFVEWYGENGVSYNWQIPVFLTAVDFSAAVLL